MTILRFALISFVLVWGCEGDPVPVGGRQVPRAQAAAVPSVMASGALVPRPDAVSTAARASDLTAVPGEVSLVKQLSSKRAPPGASKHHADAGHRYAVVDLTLKKADPKAPLRFQVSDVALVAGDQMVFKAVGFNPGGAWMMGNLEISNTVKDEISGQFAFLIPEARVGSRMKIRVGSGPSTALELL